MIRRPPRSPLFPSPPLSRSRAAGEGGARRRQLSGFDRLGRVLRVAGGGGGLSIFDPAIRRQGGGGDPPAALGVERSDFAEESVTVLFRHADIADKDIEGRLGKCL